MHYITWALKGGLSKGREGFKKLRLEEKKKCEKLLRGNSKLTKLRTSTRWGEASLKRADMACAVASVPVSFFRII